MEVFMNFINAMFGSILSLDPVSAVKMVVMWAIGGTLIYLAIKKDMEPSLLLPMGFGAILVNLPLSGAIDQMHELGIEVGALSELFRAGISNELFPLLLFIGIGAMIDFGPLLAALLKMGCVFLFGVLCTLLYNRIMVYVSQGTMRAIRDDLFPHMERLPIRYFDTHAHGDIMSIYTNDIDTLRQMISQSMPQLVSSAVTIVSVFCSMLALSLPLTGLTLVMVCLMLFTTKKLTSRSGAYFVAQQRNLGTVNGYIEEMMEGQKVVKVFCHEDESIARFDALNDALADSADNANRYANILMPVMANIGNLSYVLTAILGSLLALFGTGGFTLGGLASFLQFNKSFNQPISQVSQQFNSIIMALAGAERVFSLMDEPPETDEGYVELVNAEQTADGSLEECRGRTGVWAWKHYHRADGSTTYRRLEGEVVFDDVDFGYDDAKIILHNVSLYARPGQKIAFVGATGAGKTTITNLINRFYDIADGKIRYDGINVNKIKKADLRRSLGIVLQDTHLFTGTVADNIRYGKLDATDAEVTAAAQLAGAHAFIEHLPDGYNTLLTGDGANLSQGQRQLLAIARAAVADPPVLILDEATSGLDPVSRDELLEIFLQLAQDEGISILFSTHITSDLEKCADHIVYLRRGEVAADADADALHARYRTAALTAAQRDAAPEGLLLGCKREREGFSALLRAEDAPRLGADTAPASLEDIMVHLEKEDGGL